MEEEEEEVEDVEEEEEEVEDMDVKAIRNFVVIGKHTHFPV